MNLHSACRALLSCATLLAVTAAAAPSPCLSQRPPAAQGQQPAPHQPGWRNPCHLEDAQKLDDEQKNDGEDPLNDERKRWDDIDMLTHLNAQGGNEPQPLWLAPDADGQGGSAWWQAHEAPVDGPQHGHPRYQGGNLSHGNLHSDSAGVTGAIPAVPEPAQGVMLLAGVGLLAGVAAWRRRS
jgi:hypothetical protein